MNPEMIEINDPNAEELAIYSSLNEAQLRHYFEPEGGLFIAESRKVIFRALDAGYEPLSILADKERIPLGAVLLERAGDIPVYISSIGFLKELTGSNISDGFLCAMKRKMLPSAEEVCRNARRIAVLEDVENPTNVGAIFRSAAAMGIDAVLLTPECADPLYRRAIRVSMGNVFLVPWTYITNRENIWREKGVDILHGLGFRTAAMALRNNTRDIRDETLKQEEKLAVLLGNESAGLSDRTIERSDYTVKIPMTNGVDSLNVAAASAVAFWELAMK